MISPLLGLTAQADKPDRLTHSVGRLIWDTSLDDQQLAHRLQQDLSHWSNTTLSKIIEHAFQQHCPPGQTWRINRLELDLGEIAFDDLQTELPKRLRACLSEQLRRLLLNADWQTENPEQAELKTGLHHDSQILSHAHSLNDYIDCFLRNGTVPWWYTGNESHAAILQQQLRNAPQQIAAIIRKAGKAETVRKRIAWQYRQHQIEKIITVLEPHHHDYIVAFADQLIGLQAKTQQPHSDRMLFERQSWLWILTHLLVDRGSLFNTVFFVESTLKQMAHSYQLDYLTLLQQLTNAAQSVDYKSRSTPQFIQALLAVRQKALAQSEQDSAPEREIDYWQRFARSLRSERQLSANGEEIGHLGELFTLLAAEDAAQMTALLKKEGQETKVRQKLISQLSQDELAQVVSLLAPQDHSFILAHAHQSRELLTRHKTDDGLVWEVILAYLLKNSGSYFNRRQFVDTTLQAISRARGIDYLMLLDMLSATSMSYPRFELLAILSDLKRQNQSRQDKPQQTDAVYSQALTAYLSTGHMAKVIANRYLPAPGQLFSILLCRQPQQLAAVIAAVFGAGPNQGETVKVGDETNSSRQHKIQRLLALIQPADFPLVLRTLDAQAAKFAASLIEQLSRWQRQQQLPSLSGFDLAYQLYGVVLDVLIRGLASNFTVARFLPAFFAELSASHGINSQALAAEILLSCSRDTIKNNLSEHDNQALRQWLTDSEAGLAGIRVDAAGPHGNEGFLTQKTTALWCYLRGDKAGLQRLSLVYEPKTLTELLAALLPAHADLLLERLQHQRDRNLLTQALLKQAELSQLRQWLNTLWPTDDKPAAEFLAQWQNAIAESGLWQGASAVLQQKLHDIFWLSVLDRALITQGRIGQDSINALLAEVVRLSCFQLHIGLEQLNELACLNHNAVDLSSVKPSPKGEGWVRGNQNKEESLFNSPHPNLLPQGEGVRILKSTALCFNQAPLWQSTVVRLTESSAEPLSDPALAPVITGQADAENHNERLAETDRVLPVQADQRAFLQDLQGRYLHHPLLPELCRYLLIHGRAPLWLLSDEPLNLPQMIADLLQSQARLLRRIIQSVRHQPAALFRLHRLVDYRDLLAAVVQTEPELKALSAMLGHFYQGLLQLRFSAIDRALPASLLWQSTLQAWLSGDWQGLSAQHIAAGLSGELIRRYAITAAQVEAEFKRNERHFPVACRLTLPPEQFDSQANGLHRRHNGNLIPSNQNQSNTAAITKNKPAVASTPTNPTTEQSMPIQINNAGLVLLQGFIATYFSRLALVKDHAFVSEQARRDAVHHLQYLATGFTDTEEQHLVLNKLLCGLSLSEPVESGIKLTAEQMQTGDSLIKAVIDHWTAIGSSSINGFRGNWLVRNGLLSQSDERWNLMIEKRPYDLLLQRAPFSYGIINLPWMAKPLYVTWPT